MWQIEISHEGLHKYRVIKGTDKFVVEQKASAQKAAWDELWQKRLDREKKEKQREQRAFAKEGKVAEAHEKTEEAIKQIEEIKIILQHTLNINDAVNWESLKDKAWFPKPSPKKKQLDNIPNPPLASDRKPQLGILDKIFSSRGQSKIDNAKALFENDYKEWQKRREKIIAQNKAIEEQHIKDLEYWEKEKQEFLNKQKESNDAIEARKKEYFENSKEAIVDYCDLVLSLSEYPDYFPQEFDVDYNPLNKIVIVEYTLPSIEKMPSVKEVKYIQSRNKFVETYLSDSTINKLYDDLVYQITLRTIHELFEADVINAIEAIVFNGWVETVDKATGKKIKPCILSV